MRDVLAGRRRRYATRHTSWISLCQIWRAQYASVCSWGACMRVACMVCWFHPPAGAPGSTVRDGTVEVLRLPPLTLFAPEDNQS